MEDSSWLRVVTIGLVLAAFAIGYLLISGRFSPFRTTAPDETAIVEQTPQPTSTPQVLGQNTPSPQPTAPSAYSRIAERTKGGTQILPNTGFPAFLVGILSASAMIVGFGLRKFPK
ncbi:hypothetical protein HYS94_03035 [Candidatus Daviesbacteria bacterium]|nr:hypothetical protein [Candidatus Daviesbacteria bacterium]